MIQRHDNIWQSNVPRFVSRCSCLVFHEMGWSSIACSKRLLVTRSWDCLHHPPSPNDSSCVRPNVPPVTPVDLEYVFHLSVALHRVRCARSRSTNVSVVRDGSNSSEMLWCARWWRDSNTYRELVEATLLNSKASTDQVMWQSSTGLGGHSKQQTIHKMASSWRFPDSEWTHGHDHRHGWALGKQIVPQHVFGEDDENKRGFYMQIGILKVKSLNLGLWLYIIGFFIWVRGQFAMASTTYIYIMSTLRIQSRFRTSFRNQ